ncbi:PAS domain-containing sensor histidine kinase [uncultured Cytophaga sp.]|uniref:PAS domain-containing sensor histidine kinase n=1 Tax=uncultured Cytophaga sp. TaxID=160238 RepID=UPI002605850C|nr:PAS domain-containing sensor histidine kinase [uncultured Cytophaga sp.]
MENIRNKSYNTDKHFDLSMDLMCIAGYDGFFKKINPAVTKHLGYSESELYSKPINDFVHPEDKIATIASRLHVHQNKPLLNFENRYLTKKGSIVWLLWTSMPSDEEQLVYAVAKNITHKKIEEENKKSLIIKYTNENNNFKHFSYTISHDLRSPINNLISIVDFINIEKINDEQTQESFSMLKKSSTHLKDTVENYIDNLNSNKSIQNTCTELNLTQSLNEVLTSIDTFITSSNTKIHIDFSETEIIQFNKIYLESIFLNLITNAIKYSRKDHTPTIHISSRKQHNIDQLIIQDNGLGFNLSEMKDELFGFNKKFHDHPDSNGIGLYLVYNHIHSMGGKIEIESEVNIGTTFTISFINNL